MKPFVRQSSPPMFFRLMRSDRRLRIAPLMRRGWAAQRGATQPKFPSGQTVNVHLPPLEFSLAKNADPLVIERIPAPEGIAYAQDREPIIEIKMSDHTQRALCSSHRATQSEGRLIRS